ncbi:glycosyltransferase family 2 protein [Sphingobacterium sp. BIGb0116]|uniref:glycosyltransferase family 2 protein n=1 Tax=Sphingobacterium sp. BIGb0116 TaxID=2940619 RepID=UPI00216721F7|nr:glycosyltransferase family 2 protein [Sphingobacterium sp. BIGb0116]MCS4166237.1 glycosyltransferase involved in cell wall biosynthesis [Sphingobacterium sp. BIGb0116]
MKKVSVIIPFYSNISWLDEAVDSVLEQTFQDFEIIVVNDGSPEDDSIFVAKYHNRIRYFKTENKGPAHARNFGIKVAIGEFLAFLDSDDLWMPSKLEKQVKLMSETELVWSHTKYSLFDEVENKSRREYKDIENEDFKGNVYPLCLTKLNIGTPCVMIRRDYLLKNPLIRFSENMRFGQDGFFWMLLAIDNNLGYLDESLTLVRVRGTNAVQRARVHLYVRANLYNNLIKKIDSFFPNVKISKIIKITYLYCFSMNSLIDKIFGKGNYRNRYSEFLSKILYLPAYFAFKLIG